MDWIIDVLFSQSLELPRNPGEVPSVPVAAKTKVKALW